MKIIIDIPDDVWKDHYREFNLILTELGINLRNIESRIVIRDEADQDPV